MTGTRVPPPQAVTGPAVWLLSSSAGRGTTSSLAGLRRGRAKSASLRRALSQGHSLEGGRETRDVSLHCRERARGDPSHLCRKPIAKPSGAVVRIALGPGGQGSECCAGSALPTNGGSSAGYLAVRRAEADSLPVLQTGTLRFTPWSQTRGRGWAVQLQDQTLNYLTASHALEHAASEHAPEVLSIPPAALWAAWYWPCSGSE